MSPFDYIITLLSFVYSMALAHVLAGIGVLVRHRRTVVWSVPHAIWLLNVVLYIVVNWLALWDFKQLKDMTLDVIALGTFFAIILYLMAAFVTPDGEDGDERNLIRFHDRERRTYVGATLVLTLTALGLNAAAGSAGIINWAEQNAINLAGVPALLVAMFARRVWLQAIGGLVMTASLLAFAILYYPVLR